MDEELEIILRAVDDASGTFQSVSESANEMGAAFEESAVEGSEGFEEIETSAEEATGSIQDVIDYCQNIDGSGMRDVADAADALEQESQEASGAVSDLSGELGIINSGMLLQTAEQIGNIGGKAEGMAQDMNEAAISVGQLATQTGIAEPEMVNLINTISNATFPNDEAMMYVKSLDQMGVSAENLGESATNIDKINDAFGMGAQTTNSLAQELGVLGVDMNNVSTAFNALAYANANTVGGMNNYYSFLRKYDSQFKELGYNVDQASVIIAAATQKFGGGRAALSGLSSALEEAGDDTHALEEALDMEAGSIDNATALTGQYEGQLQQLANEEAEHKTILDQLGAAWEDVSLSMSGVLSPLASAIGFVGELGSFGMTIKGLKELGTSLKATKGFITELNIAQTIQNALAGEGAIASAAAALGITTEAAAAEGATVAFGGLAIAEGAVLWPLLAIIAAAALVAVAIYEIGKSFGWWTDVSSMLEAITAGLQRLWSAFINHPDVQAVISTITGAWDALVGAIGSVMDALGEFFGLSTGGDFDIVRALIDAIGFAWETVTAPIRFIIGLLQQFIIIGSAVANGQLSLTQAVQMAWNLLQGTLGAVLNNIITSIVNWGISIVTYGINAATNFVNGVINYIKSLPGKVLSYLLKTASNVVSQFNKMVSTAKAKALALVTGAINNIKSLPGKAYTQLVKVVSKIASAGAQWVSKAKAKAQEVVNGAYNKLTQLPGKAASALSGLVNSIVKPFRDAYNKAKEWWDKISSLGTSGGHAAGFDYEGMMEELQQNSLNLSDYMVTDSTVTLDHNFNMTFDLKNVPTSINESQLLEMIEQSMTNKDVVKALVENADFQNLDSKVKQRIVMKNNRARGAY